MACLSASARDPKTKRPIVAYVVFVPFVLARAGLNIHVILKAGRNINLRVEAGHLGLAIQRRDMIEFYPGARLKPSDTKPNPHTGDFATGWARTLMARDASMRSAANETGRGLSSMTCSTMILRSSVGPSGYKPFYG